MPEVVGTLPTDEEAGGTEEAGAGSRLLKPQKSIQIMATKDRVPAPASMDRRLIFINNPDLSSISSRQPRPPADFSTLDDILAGFRAKYP